MKNVFGDALTVTLFGESHGQAIGAVLDGLAPGIPVDEEIIAHKLFLRRPYGALGTARREKDGFSILSGVYNGFTTGTPLTIVIPNGDTRSKDYEALHGIARPGHCDYAAHEKYHGFEDDRGGGHFSGRLTAALVAAGAIAGSALSLRGVMIGTHILSLHGVVDRGFADYAEDIGMLDKLLFPVLDEEKAEKMKEEIAKAAEARDSVGGILETALTGLPAGLGEPFFDSVESKLAHALFSIPGIKGVEFGCGFGFSSLYGSEANDAFEMKNGRVITATNRNGGINGGLTNGMPLIFRCAVKPTPSIGKEQKTVDFIKGENTVVAVAGRHDPAIVHRARAVVDALTALVLYDLYAGRYGTDFFGGKR
ncbi:MAG: chorismate synthase [Clostridia bacterium]|nr:chorismate synthase [Clostridia bacterium]